MANPCSVNFSYSCVSVLSFTTISHTCESSTQVLAGLIAPVTSDSHW